MRKKLYFIIRTFSNKCDILIFKVLCYAIMITFFWQLNQPIVDNKTKKNTGYNTFTLYGN